MSSMSTEILSDSEPVTEAELRLLQINCPGIRLTAAHRWNKFRYRFEPDARGPQAPLGADGYAGTLYVGDHIGGPPVDDVSVSITFHIED